MDKGLSIPGKCHALEQTIIVHISQHVNVNIFNFLLSKVQATFWSFLK